MYNKMSKEGLFKIREGIDLIINAMNEKDTADVTPVETKNVNKNETKTADVPKAPKKSAPAPEEPMAHFDKEDLDSMAYNDLKKLARDLGVSGAGSRDKIIDRILSIDLNANEDGEVSVREEAKEEAPKKSKVAKKIGKKSEPVEEDEEPEEEEVDPLYAQVIEATKEMSVEELADTLSDVGISPKGKRQALIDKIYKAVQDGTLSLDDEEEDEDEEPTDEVEEESTETVEDNSDLEDEDGDEDDDVNDPANMTTKRKKACEEYEDSITNGFKNGELSVQELKDFCTEFYGEENAEVIDDLEDEELLEYYIDAVKRMINDDGELIEDGAYEVNGEYFCCGRPLQYAEDTNKYICEICGEEYEAE
jgi:hypothetical protein